MTVPCPHCAQEVSLEDAGRFACPHCGQDFEAVNEPAGAPPPVPPSKAKVASMVITRWQSRMKAIQEPAGPQDASLDFGVWQERLVKRRIRTICSACGTAAQPFVKTQGSFAVEVALWLLFCAPGIIYSVWRLTSRRAVCPRCEGHLIPIGSPAGRKLWETFHRKEGQG